MSTNDINQISEIIKSEIETLQFQAEQAAYKKLFSIVTATEKRISSLQLILEKLRKQRVIINQT